MKLIKLTYRHQPLECQCDACKAGREVIHAAQKWRVFGNTSSGHGWNELLKRAVDTLAEKEAEANAPSPT